MGEHEREGNRGAGAGKIGYLPQEKPAGMMIEASTFKHT